MTIFGKLPEATAGERPIQRGEVQVRSLGMSGHIAKNSLRAYVFRHALELGHCSSRHLASDPPIIRPSTD